MKPGQEVYIARNHTIYKLYVVRVDGKRVALSPVAEKDLGRNTYWENLGSIHLTEESAVHARIALLEKTVRSLTTAIETHKSTIRKLKRSLK